MATRLTGQERHSRQLIERLIKSFDLRLDSETLGREALLVSMANEIGISDRMLRIYLARGVYPRTQTIISGIEKYLERVEA